MSGKKKADLKVIILGDYAVGKTSLICRYIDGKFQTQEPTVGAAFFLKQWGPYNVAVWDTAGDERYSGLSHFYCRSAGAAILAFDLNNPKTFESLWARFGSILEAANEDCLKIVVGTKVDLLEPEHREITIEEGRKLSRDLNEHIDIRKLPHDPYFETSSLANENVQEVFEYIFQYCLPLSADQKKRHRNQQKSVVDLLENSEEGDKGKKKCC
ncbi:ras-related protein Rab-20 [Aplysia californica]|uniref:Ras-related protein Rab-20 n=1 Tax=Aplysia californica TaxID=6500 RepID=A0ABM0JX19_APLCA|nr:ras-related protein Rab-20 [Aplysia californica]